MPTVALTGAGLTAALLAATVAADAASKPVVIVDPAGDVASPLDLKRVVLRRAADGRLRTVVTFAATFAPSSLPAGEGPPGSVCLRVWTAPDADPTAMRPNRLVCVTARLNRKLRAGVFEQRGSGLPRRIGPASVAISAKGRSIIIHVSQSALGGPQRIRFAAESTAPGCASPTCVDTVPDGGRTRVFRLR